MKVTLTFDNGPHPDVTPQVLTALRKHDIRSHFFVVGSMVQAHGMGLLQSAVEQGHLIGNHSFTHSTPLGLVAAAEGIAEVTQTQALIDPFTGSRRTFRPFGGGGAIGPHLLSQAVWDFLCRQGYGCTLWNTIAYEWEKPHDWIDATIERCQSQAHAVVVLHDLPTGAIAHLDDFIEKLKGIGAEFTQDLPEDCLPMVDGVSVWSEDRLKAIVAEDRATD